MKVLFSDLVRNASTFSATNETVNYNPENLIHDFLQYRFQASANSSVVTITLDADYDFDCFFYGYHNLSALTVVFKNSLDVVLDTIIVAEINDIGVEYFDTIEDVRSIELTVATISTYVYLGGFAGGLETELPDFDSDYPLNYTDNSISSKSPAGQTVYENIEPLRKYRFGFTEVEKSEAIDLLNTFISTGKRPIYIDITPDSRDTFTPIYATVEKVPAANKINRRVDMELIIEESR